MTVSTETGRDCQPSAEREGQQTSLVLLLVSKVKTHRRGITSDPIQNQCAAVSMATLIIREEDDEDSDMMDQDDDDDDDEKETDLKFKDSKKGKKSGGGKKKGGDDDDDEGESSEEEELCDDDQMFAMDELIGQVKTPQTTLNPKH